MINGAFDMPIKNKKWNEILGDLVPTVLAVNKVPVIKVD